MQTLQCSTSNGSGDVEGNDTEDYNEWVRQKGYILCFVYMYLFWQSEKSVWLHSWCLEMRFDKVWGWILLRCSFSYCLWKVLHCCKTRLFSNRNKLVTSVHLCTWYINYQNKTCINFTCTDIECMYFLHFWYGHLFRFSGGEEYVLCIIPELCACLAVDPTANAHIWK